MLNHALLVDDSKSARFALRKLLEGNGLQVDMVENAEQALGYLDSNHPDVIFMDHFMPGMDGFEALKIIKQQPSMASIPVVMCTSKDGEAYIAEARSIGAVGILSKPATSGSLAAVLEKLISVADDSLVNEAAVAGGADVRLLHPVAASPRADRGNTDTDSPCEAEDNAVIPVLEDVVIPVEEVQRVAAETAKAVSGQLIEERVTSLFKAKIPEMREMVLANFDSIVKSMLEGYIQEAMSQVKQDVSKVAQNETRSIAEQVSRDMIATSVRAQGDALEETLHRLMKDQLADIHGSISVLKTQQHLHEASPELVTQLLKQSHETATKVAGDILSKAADKAQETVTTMAREVSLQASKRMQGDIEAKLAHSVITSSQAARQEAAEIAMRKVNESQKLLQTRLRKSNAVSLLALAAAVVAIVGLLVFT